MLEEVSDPQLWQQAREVAIIALIAVAIIAWLIGFVSGLCMPFNAVPGSLPKFFSLRAWCQPDNFRKWMLLNPMNVIFCSDLLTPRGQTLRKCLIISMAVFLACLALLLLLASLAPNR